MASMASKNRRCKLSISYRNHHLTLFSCGARQVPIKTLALVADQYANKKDFGRVPMVADRISLP